MPNDAPWKRRHLDQTTASEMPANQGMHGLPATRAAGPETVQVHRVRNLPGPQGGGDHDYLWAPGGPKVPTSAAPPRSRADQFPRRWALIDPGVGRSSLWATADASGVSHRPFSPRVTAVSHATSTAPPTSALALGMLEAGAACPRSRSGRRSPRRRGRSGARLCSPR